MKVSATRVSEWRKRASAGERECASLEAADTEQPLQVVDRELPGLESRVGAARQQGSQQAAQTGQRMVSLRGNGAHRERIDY